MHQPLDVCSPYKKPQFYLPVQWAPAVQHRELENFAKSLFNILLLQMMLDYYSAMRYAGFGIYPVPHKRIIVARTLPAHKQSHSNSFVAYPDRVPSQYWTCKGQILKVNLTLRATNYPLQPCVTSHTLLPLFRHPTFMTS